MFNENNTPDGSPINEFTVLSGHNSIPVEVKSLESKDKIQNICLNVLLAKIEKESSSFDLKISILILMRKNLDKDKVNEILLIIRNCLNSLIDGKQTIFSPLCEVRVTPSKNWPKNEVSINLYYETNKYRAIRDNVKKASKQIPMKQAGVVHVFLPPDQLYDIFSSVEESYNNLKKLVLGTPNIGILSLDSLEIAPDAKSIDLKRYLVNNHSLSSTITQDFRVSLSPASLPPWHPTDDNFTISFILKTPSGSHLPNKDAEVIWISSPHGETQLRVFIKNTGNLRFDLTIEPAGRVVVELYSDYFTRGKSHEYSFSVNSGSLKMSIDGHLIEGGYSVLSGNTFPPTA